MTPLLFGLGLGCILGSQFAAMAFWNVPIPSLRSAALAFIGAVLTWAGAFAIFYSR